MIRARAGAVVVIVLVAAVSCRHSREREPGDFERMRLQQRYDLYGQSGVFANGAAMQPPPVGTVARESAVDTGVVGSGLSGGLAVASVPISVTPQLLALGEQKFAIHCAVCHGLAGFGGSIVAANMGPPRPPSLRSSGMLALPAGYIFIVASRGKGRMPSYATSLTTEERWAVVAYVQRMQRTPAVGAAATEDSMRAVQIARIDSGVAARRRR